MKKDTEKEDRKKFLLDYTQLDNRLHELGFKCVKTNTPADYHYSHYKQIIDDLINKRVIGVIGNSGAGRSYSVPHINSMAIAVVDNGFAQRTMSLDEIIEQDKTLYLKYVNTRPMDEELLYSHLTKKQREANIVDIRREPKIARNQTCPCGSNKKYKNCCLKNK